MSVFPCIVCFAVWRGIMQFGKYAEQMESPSRGVFPSSEETGLATLVWLTRAELSQMSRDGGHTERGEALRLSLSPCCYQRQAYWNMQHPYVPQSSFLLSQAPGLVHFLISSLPMSFISFFFSLHPALPPPCLCVSLSPSPSPQNLIFHISKHL